MNSSLYSRHLIPFTVLQAFLTIMLQSQFKSDLVDEKRGG